MAQQYISEDLISLGDPEKIANYIYLFGLTKDDLNEPIRLKRFEEIIKFLDKHPDPNFFVRKAVGNKQVDRLDFIHEYVGFHQQKSILEQQKQILDSKISLYDRNDLTELERKNLGEIIENKLELERSIDNLKQEIQIYEN